MWNSWYDQAPAFQTGEAAAEPPESHFHLSVHSSVVTSLLNGAPEYHEPYQKSNLKIQREISSPLAEVQTEVH